MVRQRRCSINLYQPALRPRHENGCANAVPLDEQIFNIRDQSCRRRGNGLAVPVYGAQRGDGVWRRRRRWRQRVESSLIGQLNVLISAQAVYLTRTTNLNTTPDCSTAPSRRVLLKTSGALADVFFVASMRILLLSLCREANGSACKKSILNASI
jgi:hypothetical protein